MAKIYRLDQLIRDEWNKPLCVEPAIQQLTIWDAIDDLGRKKGSCVPLTSATHEPTHEQKITAWVQVYPVTRHGKKHKYFRFCYLSDPNNIRTLTRVHLPAGNIQNPRARALKEKVEWAIANGMTPQEIEQLIREK